MKKEIPESMTEKDALMFPLIASGALFTLFIIFRVINLNINSIKSLFSNCLLDTYILQQC